MQAHQEGLPQGGVGCPWESGLALYRVVRILEATCRSVVFVRVRNSNDLDRLWPRSSESRYFWWVWFSPEVAGLFYPVPFCGAKLETVSRREGEHLLSGIGSTRMEAIGLAEAPVLNQPLSIHVVGIMAGHLHNRQGDAKGSYQRHRGSGSQNRLGGSRHPAPSLPPPFTRSQYTGPWLTDT